MSSFAEFVRAADRSQNLLTRGEAAKCAGVSLSTVDSWMRSGYLPAVRFGRTVRVDWDDLRKVVEKRTSPSERLPRGRDGRQRVPRVTGRAKTAGITITLTSAQAAQVGALLANGAP